MFTPFDSKALIQEENERRLLEFYLSNDKKHELIPHSNLPGRLFAGHLIAYDRQRIPVGEHSIDIIKKDTEVSHFIWRTSPANFNQAIDDGIIPLDMLDALTARVRQALGGYMINTRSRFYKSGILSNKHKEKHALLRLTQSRIKLFETLERCINDDDPTLSDEEKLNVLKNKIQDYIAHLKSTQSEVGNAYALLNQYDINATAQINHFIQKDIDEAQHYLNSLQEKECIAHYSASGPKSLGAFIKKAMIRQLREAQALNQNLCYSRLGGSFLRGDFNGICEDALREINLHRPDLHNRVLKEHQGQFSSDNTELAVNFQTLGKDGRAIENTLMGIAQIEGEDSISVKDDVICLTKKDQSLYPLKVTNKTKWVLNESTWYTSLRVGAWIWNVSTGIFLGLTFDLFVGLGLGLLGYRPPSLVSKFQIHLPVEAHRNTLYESLLKAMEPPSYSLGTLVGFKISNFIKNIWWDLINGATTTIKQFKFELIENLAADFTLGHHPQINAKDVLMTLKQDLIKLKAQKSEVLSYINSKSVRFKEQTPHQIESVSPVPPYRLSHGEWLDITNEAIHGARFVAETFTNNIHSKHPLAGIIFSLSYLSGVFVILTPQFMSFLPKGYLKFSHTLANAMSKGGLTKAIGSGMTQAQLFTAAFNAIIEGNDSWLAKGSREFEKNPSNILVYISLAVGLGALVAFELDIPYISETLREDLGNIPIPSLGFAGAKMGILLIDLLREKKPEAIREHIPEIRHQLDDILQKFGEFQSDSHRDHIINTLLSDAFLSSLKTSVQAVKDNMTTKEKAELAKLVFLFKLEHEKDLLPKLPTQTKRKLIELTHQYFPKHTETLKTVNQLLYPPPPQSIFIITLTTVIYYIPILIRCLASIVTLNTRPYIDLGEKVKKDLTRIGVALANAIHGLTSFFKVGFRGLFDFFGNEILAHSASLIKGNEHPLTHFNYRQSVTVDVGYETICQRLSQPIEKCKKETTFTAPAHMIKREGLWFFKQIKTKGDTIAKEALSNDGHDVTPYTHPSIA